MKIKNKRGAENLTADHVHHLGKPSSEAQEEKDINDAFLEECLYSINEVKEVEIPWFAGFANYLVGNTLPKDLDYQQRKKLLADLKHYIWEEPFLFKIFVDQFIRRCVPLMEGRKILEQCHSRPARGHFQGNRTTEKFLK